MDLQMCVHAAGAAVPHRHHLDLGAVRKGDLCVAVDQLKLLHGETVQPSDLVSLFGHRCSPLGMVVDLTFTAQGVHDRLAQLCASEAFEQLRMRNTGRKQASCRITLAATQPVPSAA